MSCFDEEPERRYLILHPESNCLFVAYNGQAEEALASGNCEDVTGIKEYEHKYSRMNK